ncbi:MAG: 2-dehydro-3-deoxyglucarate aldolase [Armatimonadetes bacterium]|nr:2-dehydro-3-deoxyglucarate aldolase [Armatimonadota bacterium]MDE2206413.1 2-dehydro-3-deoxyglucarate aldolase [Armatimonadota bacterium]
MKSNRVKEGLKAGTPQIGTWLSLASPFAARFMARTGFAWLNLDMEHSPATWETAAQVFGAVADAGGIPLVRVPFNSLENAKRALDAGTYGVIFPMCNTRAEAERAVAACKYPPAGERSVGGGLQVLNFDAPASEYYARANEQILVIVQAEHVEAVRNAEEILSVPGIDAVFVGPNDLLASMHKTPRMETDDPEFVQALAHVKATAERFGVAPGIHVADAEAARRRVAEGWKFIAISSELGFMLETANATVEQAIGVAAAGVGARY